MLLPIRDAMRRLPSFTPNLLSKSPPGWNRCSRCLIAEFHAVARPRGWQDQARKISGDRKILPTAIEMGRSPACSLLQRSLALGIYTQIGSIRFIGNPGRSGPRNHLTERQQFASRTTLNYVCAVIITVLGLSYAAVPMYRMFCQVTGIGGASNLAQHGDEKVEALQKVTDRALKIVFTADTASHLQWNFKPVQREVTVFPGETALAFYTAENPTDRHIVGISTYTVLPFEAAKYLNKIQCFCFEEQRLNPHEKVDMPVFFYIDPEYVNDPWLIKADTITLAYTFFEAKDGMKFLPQGTPSPHNRVTPSTGAAVEPA
ncbi:Cytochrome c oxidase assembly protein COX11, mitochondrial [Hypsibius exemplaris]|uniref:Cytochrome c oxidase assembly protein COX11, mitochondrial n=1 Tax=Hypsibius exemplaris TaxID=2072580 RepID=A0A1W0WJ53_HYPEX|nr:Cytochrome c oxidase assembly protein COX11, mitochondrial [Hypsibius exemplaris]